STSFTHPPTGFAPIPDALATKPTSYPCSSSGAIDPKGAVAGGLNNGTLEKTAGGVEPNSSATRRFTGVTVHRPLGSSEVCSLLATFQAAGKRLGSKCRSTTTESKVGGKYRNFAWGTVVVPAWRMPGIPSKVVAIASRSA